MLRSVGAVVGGFLVMALAVGITTALSVAMILGRPQPGVPLRPTADYLAVNLVCGLAAAVLGGYICARLATANPLGHAAALAAVVIAMSVGGAMIGGSGASGQPPWYPYAMAAIGGIGILIGGGIRHRSSG